MTYHFPETVALFAKAREQYEAECKARGIQPKPGYYNDDGTPADPPAPQAVQEAQAEAPRAAGHLNPASKAERAREVMRQTKDSGMPLDAVIELIMQATGHDKALAKATYKANAARVGITL